MGDEHVIPAAQDSPVSLCMACCMGPRTGLKAGTGQGCGDSCLQTWLLTPKPGVNSAVSVSCPLLCHTPDAALHPHAVRMCPGCWVTHVTVINGFPWGFVSLIVLLGFSALIYFNCEIWLLCVS